ncbi:MAG: serine/threonine protein kinase [Candidatus Obscuribacterales bacterium]
MATDQKDSSEKWRRTWDSQARADSDQRETTWSAPRLFMPGSGAGAGAALPGDAFSHIPESSPLVGRTIFGTYKINRLLGEGGMAVVYEATDVNTGRSVAVKTLKYSENDLSARFARELQIHSKLKHPNIVEAIASLEDDKGQPFFVMELLHGLSMEDFLDKHGQLEGVEAIASVLSQLCEALEYAHNRKVVHRDIKPENVVLTGEKDRLKVTVLDFGLAKIQADLQRLTKTGVVLGSPAYMSPEQCTGTGMDQRSDIYSLGVVAYELIAGDLPFEASSPVEMMKAHCDQSIKPTPLKEFCPDLPGVDALSAILEKMMSVQVEERHNDINEVKRDLDAWWRGATSQVAGTISPFNYVETAPAPATAAPAPGGAPAAATSREELSSIIRKQRETGIEIYAQQFEKEKPAGHKDLPVKKILVFSGLGILALVVVVGAVCFLGPIVSEMASRNKPAEPVKTVEEELPDKPPVEETKPRESKIRKIRAPGWVEAK